MKIYFIKKLYLAMDGAHIALPGGRVIQFSVINNATTRWFFEAMPVYFHPDSFSYFDTTLSLFLLKIQLSAVFVKSTQMPSWGAPTLEGLWEEVVVERKWALQIFCSCSSCTFHRPMIWLFWSPGMCFTMAPPLFSLKMFGGHSEM